MGPVNEPIFDRNENNFIREGWGGKRWEEKGRRGMGREGGGEEKGRKEIGREGGGRKREGEGLGEKRWEEKGRRGMGREGGEEKGRKGIGREGGGEEKGRRGIGREGGRKDSVPVQNKQKTKQNKSNNPQAHGMSA